MARTAVEQIKERLTIVDVVSSYVELKHAGKNFKARSPFTNEKTPSFYVSPDRGMYYCFSSQQGGDMFTFVQKMEGVDFKGALKILAERAGVELVPEDPKTRDARETQYALLEEATNFFYAAREAHSAVSAYLENRGVKEQTIISWRIGYAKDEWRGLRSHLRAKGFSDHDMRAVGLIKDAGEGKEPYDVFRDRIMFPIMDVSGRVVAFSGRTLKTESGIPKYVNSPETDLYQKSEILYGYDRAKHGIRNYKFSLVVEGQFDLVLAHQAGYTNTVAVSGTALTPHHIGLLMRLAPNVVLALDADRAGISAMKRSAVPMLEAGMDVKIAAFPEGQDPADVVRRDPHELKKIVGGATHCIDFLLEVLRKQTTDERTYRLRVREEVLPLIVAIDNRMDREHFEEMVANRTGSTKESIHHEVQRIEEEKRHERPRVQVDAPVAQKMHEKGDRRRGLAIHLMALMRVSESRFPWLRHEIKKVLLECLQEDGYKECETYTEEHLGPALFTLDAYIEEVSERQLIEDTSHALTEFARLTARENLRISKEALLVAESLHDTAKIDELMAGMRHAERLLAAFIQVQKPGA
jgi:DNA primase